MNRNRVFAATALLAAAGAVVFGLYLNGTPAEQRLVRQDEQRRSDLSRLSAAIDIAYQIGNSSLPQTLEEVLVTRRLRGIPVDPVSGENYDYEIVAENQYRLCALFARPSEEYGIGLDFWQHGAGRRCFTIALEPAG